MNFRQLNSVGLTLVELMVAMVLSLVLMAAVYMAYQVQHKTSVEQDAVSIMQQDQRAAMDLISRDIKTAGCNPRGVEKIKPLLGIFRTSSGSSSLALVADLSGKESPGEPVEADGYVYKDRYVSRGEFVVYSFYSGKIYRRDYGADPGDGKPVSEAIADHVTDFKLVYWADTCGTGMDEYSPSKGDGRTIRRIQVTITSAINKNGVVSTRQLRRTIMLRNIDQGGNDDE